MQRWHESHITAHGALLVRRTTDKTLDRRVIAIAALVRL
jgi:hypothetical protein